ncbi:hypothetical protein M422DRAFT_242266 [Sphaerobolus stellatus SS14]|nr:hypothetical protein M422DRAFT_242266 [Sphaerobolus stellatus SS14]
MAVLKSFIVFDALQAGLQDNFALILPKLPDHSVDDEKMESLPDQKNCVEEDVVGLERSGAQNANQFPERLQALQAIKRGKFRQKHLINDDTHTVAQFSMKQDALVSTTGWHGTQPRSEVYKRLVAAWDSLDDTFIHQEVSKMTPVPYRPGHGTLFRDKENRLFACRTSLAAWLSEVQTELWDAIKNLLDKDLKNVSIQKKNKDHVRSHHLPCIMGFHHQYQEHPMVVAWHSQHADLVDVRGRL